MAWNQPGGQNNPWSRRPGQGPSLDEHLRSLQRRLGSFLRPRRGGRRSSWWITLAALAATVWVWSGFYQVSPGERAIVQRFGRLTEVESQGGLHFHLPWPFETLQKVNVEQINSSIYPLRVLTRDVNLLELRFAVQYRLSNPLQYLFEVRDPGRTLNEVSESAIREVVGQSTAQEVLVGNTRRQMTQRIQARIQETLSQYGTGITVTTVSLTDVQVPDAVQASQRDTDKARADQTRALEEAQAYARSILPQAEGAAASLKAQAESYRTQVLKTAQGQADSFLQLLDAYNQAPAVTRRRLYMDTIESVLSQAHKVLIDVPGKPGGGNLFYLPLDKLLEKSGAHEPQATPPATPAPKEPDVRAEAPRGRGER